MAKSFQWFTFGYGDHKLRYTKEAIKTSLDPSWFTYWIEWQSNFYHEEVTVSVVLSDVVIWSLVVPADVNHVDFPAYVFKVGESTVTLTTVATDGEKVTGAALYVTVYPIEAKKMSPQGYLANEKIAIFSWTIQRLCYPNIENSYVSASIISGKLQWRDGAAGTMHSITLQSGATSVTVPAGTFPDSANIQWRLANLTTAADDDVTSDWYTITTIETSSSAAPLSPVDTTVDGAKAITFQWSHSITTGTAPTGFTLQISTDGTTWSTLASKTGTGATSYTAEADRFTAGKLFWRVQTLNTDGIAGSWSEAAEITVISAPPTPAISIVSMAPRFAIRWATSGQQSYELRIDGALYAYKFGTEGNYQHDDFLPDGAHTVAVRVQNSLGLWSDWGTAALTIKNAPGAAINLLVSSLDTRAILAWSGESYDEYWVYRDGVRIAKTADVRASDDFAVGKSSYYVIGFNAESGNYTESNTVETETAIRDILITDVQTRETAVLRWAESSSRILSSTRRHSVVYTHYAGSALPEAEIGESRNRYYELTAAFRPAELEDARRFAAMTGRFVCIRDMQGERFFGIYDEISVRDNLNYVVCAATARAVRYSEG